jgi:hypothetical protein
VGRLKEKRSLVNPNRRHFVCGAAFPRLIAGMRTIANGYRQGRSTTAIDKACARTCRPVAAVP